MKKSERNLLVITICAAVLFLISWGHGSKGKGKAPSIAGVAGDRTATFPTLPEIEDDYSVAYAESRLDFLPVLPDMKDPFGIYVPDTKELGKVSETVVRLTGVFRDGERSYALVSQEMVIEGESKTKEKLVTEGESIGGWTVTRIEGDGIWLTKAGKKRFLKLHKPKPRREQKTDTAGNRDDKSVNKEEDK